MTATVGIEAESRQPPPQPRSGGNSNIFNVYTGMEQQQETTTTSSSSIPSELELSLLCLDYLRDLRRRAYPNKDLLEQAEGLKGDYLTVAVYALSRAFEGHADLQPSQNDPWMQSQSSSENTPPSKEEEKEGDESNTITLPSLADMERAIMYTSNPHKHESKEDEEDSEDEDNSDNSDQDDPYHWYDYDDEHASNAHRFYGLQGLASGPTLTNPLTLGELVTAGLTHLHAKSRHAAEQNMIQSPLFAQFVQAVEQKGFFQMNPPNSSMNGKETELMSKNQNDTSSSLLYQQRFAKVVCKFRTKLAAKAMEAEDTTTTVQQPHSVADLQQARRYTRCQMVLQQNKNSNNKNLASPKPLQVSLQWHETKTGTNHNHNHNTSAVGTRNPQHTSTTTTSHNHHNPRDLEEAERLKSLGNAHMQKKEYPAAAAAYTQALQLAPSGPQSHVYYSNRAAALLSQKQFAQAILDSERSLALQPHYGKAHARLGLAHFLLGDYRPAMEAYTVALKYEPDNKSSQSYLEKAAKRLAQQQEKQQQNNTAITETNSFSVVSEWDKSSRNKASGGTTTGGDAATAQAQQAQQQNDVEAEKKKTQGNQYMAQKDYPAAYEAYTEAIRLSSKGPQSHVYYSNRAASLCYLERYHDAEHDSLQSIQLKPTYGKAHARLGLSRFFMADYPGAMDAYQKALELDPDNAASKTYLAKAKSKYEKQQQLLKLKQQEKEQEQKEQTNATTTTTDAPAAPPQRATSPSTTTTPFDETTPSSSSPNAAQRRLLNDPEMQRIAKQAMQHPETLMEDPQVHQMARKAMKELGSE